MPTSTLTSKGQITLPKEIRDRLQLKTGQKIEFSVTEGGQVLMRPRSSALSLKGIVKVKPGQNVSIDQLNAAIADGWGTRWRRFTKSKA